MTNQLVLLGILMDGKTHGYQLNDYVKHALSLYTNLKKSTTYFVLNRLEEQGYVTHEIERKGKRPERRVYEITEEGKVYFRELLKECIGNYTPTRSADDIGVAFLGKLKTTEAKTLLEAKRQKIKNELDRFKGIQNHGGSMKHVIEHSLSYLNADLKWVDSILKTYGIKGASSERY